MLAAISNDKVPLWVGIVIVTVCSFLVAIFGIKQVIKVETYLSVPVLTAFLLLYISSSDKYSFVNAYVSKGNLDSSTRKGNWMSFFHYAIVLRLLGGLLQQTIIYCSQKIHHIFKFLPNVFWNIFAYLFRRNLRSLTSFCCHVV